MLKGIRNTGLIEHWQTDRWTLPYLLSPCFAKATRLIIIIASVKCLKYSCEYSYLFSGKPTVFHVLLRELGIILEVSGKWIVICRNLVQKHEVTVLLLKLDTYLIDNYSANMYLRVTSVHTNVRNHLCDLSQWSTMQKVSLICRVLWEKGGVQFK